jgi:ribonuclease HI
VSSGRRLTIYTDGAARGNPGPAGAGAAVYDADGAVIDEAKRYLGEATNNVAEYEALLLGLERARELGGERVLVRSDSLLMVKQMRGEYRVRNEVLRELCARAHRLASAFESVDYAHVRREQNREADRLANQAIDGQGAV